jgi:DNA replication and repair protein RecF
LHGSNPIFNMFIRELSVINYKNLVQADLSFSQKLNCFIGNNGVGKTNLLDCIYYLSFCKSYFNIPDTQSIRHAEDFFVLQGKYERSGEREDIYCGFKSGQKKRFRRDKKEYERLSDHIGLLPLVMISPADSILIQGGSEERRRFLDSVISQFDRPYLEWLLKYNRALQQRNNLLKYFSASQSFDVDSLDVWDSQLVISGEKIHQRRKEFLEELLPVFQKYYDFISKGNEKVSLEYNSQLNDNDFSLLLKESLARDRALQFTTVGIHKDDLDLKLGDYPIKRLGSQGQNKTYLIALKFAQFDFIRSVNEVKPILLLDDIFDKLDSERVEQIVKLVSGENFGQIFITDTNREHLSGIIREAGGDDYKIFHVVNGQVV